MVSVPDGEYMISIEVEPGSLVETSRGRRVTLAGTEIVIPITTRGFGDPELLRRSERRRRRPVESTPRTSSWSC